MSTSTGESPVSRFAPISTRYTLAVWYTLHDGLDASIPQTALIQDRIHVVLVHDLHAALRDVPFSAVIQAHVDQQERVVLRPRLHLLHVLNQLL